VTSKTVQLHHPKADQADLTHAEALHWILMDQVAPAQPIATRALLSQVLHRLAPAARTAPCWMTTVFALIKPIALLQVAALRLQEPTEVFAMEFLDNQPEETDNRLDR